MPSLPTQRREFIPVINQLHCRFYQFEEKEHFQGRLGGSVVEHLPLAQVMILESWDQVPHQAFCMETASPSSYVSASLSLCLS